MATKINNLPLLKYESYKVRIWWPPAHKQSSVKIGGIQNPYEQENNMAAFISQIIVTVIFFNGICQVIPIFAFLFFLVLWSTRHIKSMGSEFVSLLISDAGQC